MQYLGGKGKIAKQLAAFIAPAIRKRGVYVEPFVGGASVVSQIECPIRLVSDANPALITMWKAACSGWRPPTVVTEVDYNRVKAIQDPCDPLTAFVGFGCSFGGKWFAGYARNKMGNNYAAQAAASIQKKVEKLKGVRWATGNYLDMDYPTNCVIYCDPPYANTTSYSATKVFNHDEFWEFCRRKTRAGHLIAVSEYEAPSDFIAMITIETKLNMQSKETTKPLRLEKLFGYPM